MYDYHPMYVNNICINRHMWQNEECLPSIPAQMITIITIIIIIIIITSFFWHPHPIVSNITNNLPRNPQGAPGRHTLPISRFHGSLAQKAAEARPIQRWDRSPMAGPKGKHCRFMGQSNMTRIRYNMHYTSLAQNYMLYQNLHLLRYLLSWNSVTVDIHHINRCKMCAHSNGFLWNGCPVFGDFCGSTLTEGRECPNKKKTKTSSKSSLRQDSCISVWWKLFL